MRRPKWPRAALASARPAITLEKQLLGRHRMRIPASVSICLASLLLIAAAPPPTPEQAWKAGVDDENKDYAQVPHAMLKIQASAYLHDGDTTVLVGEKGNPGSYHWANTPGAHGALVVALKSGKISATKDGAVVGPDEITKSIP